PPRVESLGPPSGTLYAQGDAKQEVDRSVPICANVINGTIGEPIISWLIVRSCCRILLEAIEKGRKTRRKTHVALGQPCFSAGFVTARLPRAGIRRKSQFKNDL